MSPGVVVQPVVDIKLSGLIASSGGNFDALLQTVSELEGLGIHGLVIGEHVLRGHDMVHPGGAGLHHENRSRTSLDALVLLGWLASRTRTIRLSTSVLIGALHEPVLLARQAATLDVLSGGRFDLGVAGGWYEPEFTSMGVPFHERFARMEEGLRVCRALWAGPAATFSGRWTRLESMTSDPMPVTEGGPPVWIGGRASTQTARRVAELADGWVASEVASQEDVGRAVDLIRSACAVTSRPLDSVGIRATLPKPGPDQAHMPVEARVQVLTRESTNLIRAGATRLTLPLREWAPDGATVAPVVTGLVQALSS